MAERKEREAALEVRDSGPPPEVTKGGVKYRDLELGKEGAGTVNVGDDATIYYQGLKLGKRSSRMG